MMNTSVSIVSSRDRLTDMDTTPASKASSRSAFIANSRVLPGDTLDGKSMVLFDSALAADRPVLPVVLALYALAGIRLDLAAKYPTQNTSHECASAEEQSIP